MKKASKSSKRLEFIKINIAVLTPDQSARLYAGGTTDQSTSNSSLEAANCTGERTGGDTSLLGTSNKTVGTSL
jgi:hypothetical protein